MQVHLKQADSTHCDQIEPLVAAYHAFEQIESSASDRRQALHRLLSDRSLGGIWLVQADNRLAGYIALCRGFSIEFNGFDAFVDEFYLQPEFRGVGIGKQVLRLIAEEARHLDINALHLEVARDNLPARGLYAAAGFEPRERYLLMSKNLLDGAGEPA